MEALVRKLAHVPEDERGRDRSSVPDGVAPRVVGSRETLMKRVSSLLRAASTEMLKPSQIRTMVQQGKGPHAPDDDGADRAFLTFISDAHAQLKEVLSAQRAELETIAREEEAQAEEEEEMVRTSRRDDADSEGLRIHEARLHEMRSRDGRQFHEVLLEILSTEARYIADLRFVVTEFLAPMRNLLPPRAHADVFSNLEQLAELHTRLEDDLKPARLAEADEERGERIAQAFSTLSPFFKMYNTYAGNYANVPEALRVARAVPGVEAFLEEADRLQGRQATLEALLFRPVQRMCLYPLLFKQALGHCLRVENNLRAERTSRVDGGASGGVALGRIGLGPQSEDFRQVPPLRG